MTWHLIDDPDNQPPKDGTVVFLWHVTKTNPYASFDSNVKKGRYLPELGEWQVENVGGNCPPVVSHWAPMLPPPDTQEIE